MKKLLIIAVLLVASASLAGKDANGDWIHPSNGGKYNFVELLGADTNVLNTLTLDNAPHSKVIISEPVYDIETGEEIVPAGTRQKTLEEWLVMPPVWKLDRSGCMILLRVKTRANGRYGPQTASEAGLFASLLAPKGYNRTKWFGVETYWAKLSSPDYTAPEE